MIENSVSMDLDLPIDPNEPTYCLCNRVSFGEMVACDNSVSRENGVFIWFVLYTKHPFPFSYIGI